MNFKFFIISIILIFGFVSIVFTQTISAEKEFSREEIDEMKSKAVLITMNDGSFMIELFPEDAPNTVNNFLKLVESGLLRRCSFSSNNTWVYDSGRRSKHQRS